MKLSVAWIILMFNMISLHADPINLALHKHAKASSVEVQNTNALSADKAFDSVNYNGAYNGQRNRWASNWQKDLNRDSGWIFVDLETKTHFDSIAIFWEHSGAKKYDVQIWTSEIDTPSYNDDARWKTVYSDTALKYNDTLKACLRFKKLDPIDARYVRIRGYKRLFDFGYSIFEFEIYNTSGVTTINKPPKESRNFVISKTQDYVSIQLNEVNKMVKAQIFTSMGKLIQTLNTTVGVSNLMIWNYRDQMGQRVKPGNYLFKINIDGKIESRTLPIGSLQPLRQAL